MSNQTIILASPQPACAACGNIRDSCARDRDATCIRRISSCHYLCATQEFSQGNQLLAGPRSVVAGLIAAEAEEAAKLGLGAVCCLAYPITKMPRAPPRGPMMAQCNKRSSHQESDARSANHHRSLLLRVHEPRPLRRHSIKSAAGAGCEQRQDARLLANKRSPRASRADIIAPSGMMTA